MARWKVRDLLLLGSWGACYILLYLQLTGLDTQERGSVAGFVLLVVYQVASVWFFHWAQTELGDDSNEAEAAIDEDRLILLGYLLYSYFNVAKDYLHPRFRAAIFRVAQFLLLLSPFFFLKPSDDPEWFWAPQQGYFLIFGLEYFRTTTFYGLLIIHLAGVVSASFAFDGHRGILYRPPLLIMCQAFICILSAVIIFLCSRFNKKQ